MTGRLADRVILVTRAAEDAEPWIETIRSRGARALSLPCIATENFVDAGIRATLVAGLETASWIVFTSRRGVAATADLLEDRMPAGVRIAVVGPSTAEEAEARFGRTNFVSAGGTGRALAHELAGLLALDAGAGPRCVLVAAADRGRRDLEEVLGPAGCEVLRVAVYRTVPAPPRTPRVDLGALGVNTILLASPSAVEGLLNQAEVPAEATVISIGPSTTEAARASGLEVAGEAPRPDLEGLLEVIP